MTQKKLLVVFLTLLLALLFPAWPLAAAADEAGAPTLKRLQEENKKTEELLEKYIKTKLKKYNQAVVFVHDEAGQPVDITLRIYYSDQVQERITTAKGRFNNVFNHGATIPETVLSLAIEKHPAGRTCQVLAIKIQGPKLVALDAYLEKLKLLLEKEIKNKAAEKTTEKVIEKVLSSLGWTAEKISVFLAAFALGKDLATPVKDYLEEKFEEIIQAAKEQNALVQKVLVEETNPAYEETASGGWSGPLRENVGIEKVGWLDGFWPRYHQPLTRFQYDIGLRCQEAQPPAQLKWHETSYYFRIRQPDTAIIDINLESEPSADKQALLPTTVKEASLKSTLAQTFSQAGLTPNRRGYFMDNLLEALDLALTFKTENKIKKIWQQAEEKLAEAEEMAVKNQLTAFNLAGEKYQERLKRMAEELNKAKSDQAEKKSLDLMETKIAAHQFILARIADHVSEPAKPTIEKMAAELIKGSDKNVRGLTGDQPTIRYQDAPAKNQPAPTAKPEPAKKDALKKTAPEKAKAVAPSPSPAKAAETSAKNLTNVCGDSTVAGAEECDPPGKQAGCYEGGLCDKNCLCQYAVEAEICGDGRLTFSETCDGNQFSQPCLDSLADYKKIYNNPNLTLRCFNNCRGCELASPRE